VLLLVLRAILTGLLSCTKAGALRTQNASAAQRPREMREMEVYTFIVNNEVPSPGAER
jgi:hypothetical protein